MSDSLGLIRRRIARIEGRAPLPGRPAAAAIVATGHPGIDAALGGGLARGHLHELLADPGEAGSGTGLVAGFARMFGGEQLWLIDKAAWRQAGMINAAGLAAIGIDPARLVMGVLDDAATVLRAAADGLRCSGLGVVVIGLSGDPRAFDLTASRRLALATEASGVSALMLRLGGHAAPSAAQTRWHVAAAPSVPLAANAPGHPAWEIELLRQRGRPDGGQWRVEWDGEQGRLRDWHEAAAAALSGAVVSAAGDRPAGAGAPLRVTG